MTYIAQDFPHLHVIIILKAMPMLDRLLELERLALFFFLLFWE
jgi:hypothetical protein